MLVTQLVGLLWALECAWQRSKQTCAALSQLSSCFSYRDLDDLADV